jgi:hypothetical protein
VERYTMNDVAHLRRLMRWRKLLAVRLRSFRKVMGRWPDKQIVAASKRGIDRAMEGGYDPPWLH